jgi:glycosyltransferase involved in cell wall biosynthesis
MKRVLITAYDVDPYSGSESATGWNYIYNLSKSYNVVAVTRKNNKENIERYRKEFSVGSEELCFEYYDLPRWATFWKKGSRGSMLYYYLWQIGVALVNRNKKDIDLVHSLNFHCDWLPSFLWILGKPFVWGPVSHHEPIPYCFAKEYSLKVAKVEKIKGLIKQAFWRFDPFIYMCRKKAVAIIGGHYLVKKRLRLTSNYIGLSQVASHHLELGGVKTGKDFVIIAVGRIIPLKGFDLVLRGLARFLDENSAKLHKPIYLDVVGDGPYMSYLQKLGGELGLAEYIKFHGWIEKDCVVEKMASSSVFCFPSHEGAGMVVAEALSVGTPIICFDNYGPGTLVDENVAIKVSYKNYNEAVEGISNAISELYFDEYKLTRMSVSAKKYFEENLTWEVKTLEIAKIYEQSFTKT